MCTDSSITPSANKSGSRREILDAESNTYDGPTCSAFNVRLYTLRDYEMLYEGVGGVLLMLAAQEKKKNQKVYGWNYSDCQV